MIIFNLFSLGAWHIAESVGVPTIVISPCLIPYGHPASFPADFASIYPQLHAQVHAAKREQVGWSDVEHW